MPIQQGNQNLIESAFSLFFIDNFDCFNKRPSTKTSSTPIVAGIF